MGQKVSFRLVDSLQEVLTVRSLRNACRQYMTNYQGRISLFRQVLWYFNDYRHARRASTFLLYLCYSEAGSPVGYGALRLQDHQFYVTACVGPDYRGKGYGKAILAEMISIAQEKNRDLVAEIWVTNERSITMHEKAGFTLCPRSAKADTELRAYGLKCRDRGDR